MKRLYLFFRTLMALKAKQIYYRLFYLLRGKLAPPGKIKNCHSQWIGLEQPASFIQYRQWQTKDIEQNCFIFLNKKCAFGRTIDWKAPKMDRLWRYNLNYFQYLLCVPTPDKKVCIHLMIDWIEKNPVATPDAWDPFPTSLRIVNWLKFLQRADTGQKELKIISHALKQQCLWLEKHLEYHLMGNHLFKNGKALMFMGLFFRGTDADRWLGLGRKIIEQELIEQILDDGGHFERSPMYHSMILEDCLDLLNILISINNPALKQLAKKVTDLSGKMASYLSLMCFPDGKIALFNDAAFGIEADPMDILTYYEQVTGNKAAVLSDKFYTLSETGYYILSPSNSDKMIIDCGPVGPDYQAGHSHCDTLSFEFCIRGRRVIVDSGCAGYEDNSCRRYNRGNKGHNTVTIDGENQSEVWGSHRCALKAVPLQPCCCQLDDHTLFFRGGHNGYTRLKGRPIHFREVTCEGSDWLIKDIIHGAGIHSIQSRLHINPLLDLEINNNEAHISFNREVLLKITLINRVGMKQGKIEKKKGWYCPEFGKKHGCTVLEYNVARAVLPYVCGWKFTTFQKNTFWEK